MNTQTDELSLEALQALRVKQKLTDNEKWLLTARENLRDAEVELEWAANALLDAQIEVSVRQVRVTEERRT